MNKVSSKNALIIFTRNPELGKVKTRLAATIGDHSALNIYKHLIAHTIKITSNVNADKFVFYSEKIQQNDLWDSSIYNKQLQEGYDLGERMKNAFKLLFSKGYSNVIIIGSDIIELKTHEIDTSFNLLHSNDYIIGPAMDGGYYLLGMKQLKKELFINKKWGTDSVFSDTILNLKTEKVFQLASKNDIDRYEDIKDIKLFNKFLVSN